MAYFVVSYDLKKGQDYSPLIAELERLNCHRALESYWFADLNNTAADVLAHFDQFTPTDDDKLMVVEFSTKPRYTRAFAGTNAWVNARFP